MGCQTGPRTSAGSASTHRGSAASGALVGSLRCSASGAQRIHAGTALSASATEPSGANGQSYTRPCEAPRGSRTWRPNVWWPCMCEREQRRLRCRKLPDERTKRPRPRLSARGRGCGQGAGASMLARRIYACTRGNPGRSKPRQALSCECHESCSIHVPIHRHLLARRCLPQGGLACAPLQATHRSQAGTPGRLVGAWSAPALRSTGPGDKHRALPRSLSRQPLSG